MADDNTIWEMIATERRRTADELAELTDEQWRTQSQCDAWTVEELAAHLIVPFEISTPKFVLALLRNLGKFDKTILALTARVHAANSREEVITKLRANAENHWTPPKAGAEVVLAEIVVHSQDIRNAIGTENTIPAATIDAALTGIDDAEIRADYTRRIGVPSPSAG